MKALQDFFPMLLFPFHCFVNAVSGIVVGLYDCRYGSNKETFRGLHVVGPMFWSFLSVSCFFFIEARQ